MVTNIPKSTVSLTTFAKSGNSLTWDAATMTWNVVNGTWDLIGLAVTNVSKNSVTIATYPKSV